MPIHRRGFLGSFLSLLGTGSGVKSSQADDKEKLLPNFSEKQWKSIIYARVHRRSEQLSRARFKVFRKDNDSDHFRLYRIAVRDPITNSDTDRCRAEFEAHFGRSGPGCMITMSPDVEVIRRDGSLVTPDDLPEGGRLCRPYDLVRLLKHPDEKNDFGSLMYSWSQQLDIEGETFTWIVSNKLGVPYELYYLPTRMILPHPAVKPTYPDGYYLLPFVYEWGTFVRQPSDMDCRGFIIPAQQILRFRYPHPLTSGDGYSPVIKTFDSSDGDFEKYADAVFPDDEDFTPRCEMIGRSLTKYLAPHFGDNLVVEISLPPLDKTEE